MIQRYHTIIRPQPNGWFVGWVEEIPGTITYGESLASCRANLKESLQLMVDTHRDEARMCLDPSCILEPIEIEVGEEATVTAAVATATPPPAEPAVARYA